MARTSPHKSQGNKPPRRSVVKSGNGAESPAPVTPAAEPAPQIRTPERVAIDAAFRNEASARQAFTENLKPLRAGSEAVSRRVQEAFVNFSPGLFSSEELSRRRYVPPGADPADVLDAVIIEGVEAIRSSGNTPTITLHNNDELKRLIKDAPAGAGSAVGAIELDELVDLITRKQNGYPSIASDSVSARYKAEIKAQEILEAIESTAENARTISRASTADSSSVDREVAQFVGDAVNRQMKSATSPEEQLAYSMIPNSAQNDGIQESMAGTPSTFQLRPGASDVTSYHDFHTLQIAFAHVWTRIFDGQLESLGRDLYREYVQLKDFMGSNDADLQISTLEDLKRLMAEIRKLSEIVQDDIPSGLRPDTGDRTGSGSVSVKPEDVVKAGAAVLTGGASLIMEWAINELVKIGNNPVVVTWSNFPLELNRGANNIIEMSVENNAVYPGNVEIVLHTDADSYKKRILFQQWDPDTQRPLLSENIQNWGPGNGPRVSSLFNASQMPYGTLRFISEDEIANEVLLGRYLLGDLSQVLKDRARVTFRWKGRR